MSPVSSTLIMTGCRPSVPYLSRYCERLPPWLRRKSHWCLPGRLRTCSMWHGAMLTHPCLLWGKNKPRGHQERKQFEVNVSLVTSKWVCTPLIVLLARPFVCSPFVNSEALSGMTVTWAPVSNRS